MTVDISGAALVDDDEFGALAQNGPHQGDRELLEHADTALSEVAGREE